MINKIIFRKNNLQVLFKPCQIRKNKMKSSKIKQPTIKLNSDLMLPQRHIKFNLIIYMMILDHNVTLLKIKINNNLQTLRTNTATITLLILTQILIPSQTITQTKMITIINLIKIMLIMLIYQEYQT